MTPVGIAADLLATALQRIEGSAEVPDDVRRDLARAHALVAGLDDYTARCTSPASGALVALEARTRAEPWGEAGAGLEQEMLSGHVEGAFLRMLVEISKARRVLEIGMFTGYSALAMAEALPADGLLVACEVDQRAADIARSVFAETPVGALVDVRVGDATATLRELAAAGEVFDLVFVDADKAGYLGYLDALLDLDLLAADGLVVLDNTLMQGLPWAPGDESAAANSAARNGAAIAAFNDRLGADDRVRQVLLPLRDGVTLVRRAR